MRILIASDVYPPLIGGVELQMQLLGHQLVQHGHSVAVATAWQEDLPMREDDAGIDVHRLRNLSCQLPWFSSDPKRHHHPPFPDPTTVWGLRRLINRFKPDVVHAYGWMTYSCTVALAGKKIPLLLSVREYGYTCALRTMMYRGEKPCAAPKPAKCLVCATHYYGAPKGIIASTGVLLGRWLLRHKADGIHSVSTYMQQVIRRDLFGISGKVTNKQGNALPDEVIPSFRADNSDARDAVLVQAYLEQLPKEPFILFVGALRLVKGLEPLFAAYQRLVNPPPLVLIGRVAADTPDSFPANVVVLYDFPHAAVMAAWERALFGVAPSIWPEPFGSVIHEAMSKGKAVIGTTPGGQTDMIVHGETGFLVPANDEVALAEAMQRLLDDPDLKARLGRAAEARAKRFTAEMVVPQFEQLYQQLVTGPTGHAHQNNSFSLD